MKSIKTQSSVHILMHRALKLLYSEYGRMSTTKVDKFFGLQSFLTKILHF